MHLSMQVETDNLKYIRLNFTSYERYYILRILWKLVLYEVEIRWAEK